jgi:hypothetical protein
MTSSLVVPMVVALSCSALAQEQSVRVMPDDVVWKDNPAPARHPHHAWTEDGEAILQVQLIGPGGIDYIKPADDRRKSYLA